MIILSPADGVRTVCFEKDEEFEKCFPKAGKSDPEKLSKPESEEDESEEDESSEEDD